MKRTTYRYDEEKDEVVEEEQEPEHDEKEDVRKSKPLPTGQYL